MTTPRTSAKNVTVLPARFRRATGLDRLNVTELVVVSFTALICASAPALAIPLPPGVGAGTATPATAAGPRRPSAMTIPADPLSRTAGSDGPRRPMRIASALPPGCNTVLAERDTVRR